MAWFVLAQLSETREVPILVLIPFFECTALLTSAWPECSIVLTEIGILFQTAIVRTTVERSLKPFHYSPVSLNFWYNCITEYHALSVLDIILSCLLRISYLLLMCIRFYFPHGLMYKFFAVVLHVSFFTIITVRDMKIFTYFPV